ncbi:MAG: site-specific DNA-methyltransferase, partial [Gammaproteobacteria bacterium]|nr:site-specific DNA-methyltransferase [Gammaproteobacteria bacterium]
IHSVITDSPYGIEVTKMTLGNGAKKIHRGNSQWDNTPPTKDELDTLRNLSQVQIFWGGNYMANNLPPARGWLVWDKQTGANDYADCELAWTNLDIVVKKYTKSWVGANAKDTPVRLHPTQKPVDLMRWCITLTNPQGVIFDPYMGSGSTLRAAFDMGLSAIGCDVEKHYCVKAVERLAQNTLFTLPNNRLHLTGGGLPATQSSFTAEVIPPAKLPAKSPRR